jgi:2'-5' RNA ligase
MTPAEYRTFVAIELPAKVREQITRHMERLREEVPDARASWVRKENLHLTLKFLGDVPIDEIQKLSAATAKAAALVHRFELTVNGCGAFHPHGQPKVLWIGIDDSSRNLNLLHRELEEQCALVGFPREERPFHPHLTIARLRKPQGSRRLAQLHKEMGFAPGIILVSEVVVFRSELCREGSKHTGVSHHELTER